MPSTTACCRSRSTTRARPGPKFASAAAPAEQRQDGGCARASVEARSGGEGNESADRRGRGVKESMMNKISNAQIAEVLTDASATLRAQQATINDLQDKLASQGTP